MPGNGENGEAKILIIGGGVAGLATARALAREGIGFYLVERAKVLGGMVLGSRSVFPVMETGERVVAELVQGLEGCRCGEVMLDAEVISVRKDGGAFEAEVKVGTGERSGSGPQHRNLRAAALVVATGLEPVDASLIPELGYPALKDVVLSTSFGSLFSGDGLHRPSDGSKVRTVAFVQCVGSRVERRGVPYCSAVCCMNALKNAILVREIDDSIMTYVLYIDIRTHGKGYESLYRRAREKGVRFIRGQPSMIVSSPGSGRLLVVGENTLLKELYEIPADLVVLGVGLRQRQENLELLRDLGVELDPDALAGGSQEMESVRTSVPGIFLAGCVEAPKDVRESIAQGEAAAMSAIGLISRSSREKDTDLVR